MEISVLTALRHPVNPQPVPSVRPQVRFAGEQPTEKPLKTDPKPRRKMPWPNVVLLSLGFTGLIFSQGRIMGRILDRNRPSATQPANPSPNQPLMPPAVSPTTAQDTELKQRAEALLEFLAMAYILGNSMLLVTRTPIPLPQNSIRPSNLWGELHRRGITGKGMKVGVIDSGYRPTRRLPREKVTFYGDNDLKTPGKPKDYISHGTAVANIIADACPDARFVAFNALSLRRMFKEEMQINAFFKKAEVNPNLLSLDIVRQTIFGGYVNTLASAINKSLAEGVDVINISMGDGDMANRALAMEARRMKRAIRKSKRWNLVTGGLVRSLKRRIERQEAYRQKLMNLMNEEMYTSYTGKESWLLPWKAALDSAHSKNVPVVMASGNDGIDLRHKMVAGNNHFDVLKSFSHPAIILVASTNEEGLVSGFTTEHKEGMNPFVAANGSGELNTEGCWPTGTMWKFPLFPVEGPLVKLMYSQPKGTSFAAPDFSALYVMMKTVKPDLTIEEAKQVIQRVVNPVHFSKQHREVIEMSVKMAHPKTQKMIETFIADMKRTFPDKIEITPLEATQQTPMPLQVPNQKSVGREKTMVLFNARWRFKSELTPTENLKFKTMMLGLMLAWNSKAMWRENAAELKQLTEEASQHFVGHGTIAGRRLAIIDALEQEIAKKKP